MDSSSTQVPSIQTWRDLEIGARWMVALVIVPTEPVWRGADFVVRASGRTEACFDWEFDLLMTLAAAGVMVRRTIR